MLVAAAAYNVALAAWMLASPSTLFGLVGEPVPWSLEVNVLVGASILGVASLLLLGATRERFVRPALVVGLLAKTAPPLAWSLLAIAGSLSWKLWTFILLDDVVWWWPFLGTLRRQRGP